MARMKFKGFSPKRHTPKTILAWMRFGVAPQKTPEDCEFVFGKKANPVEVEIEIRVRNPKREAKK